MGPVRPENHHSEETPCTNGAGWAGIPSSIDAASLDDGSHRHQNQQYRGGAGTHSNCALETKSLLSSDDDDGDGVYDHCDGGDDAVCGAFFGGTVFPLCACFCVCCSLGRGLGWVQMSVQILRGDGHCSVSR